MLASFANVFDLRAMVSCKPIPFHASAAYVQMHPKMSSTCILASQNGQMQVVDTNNVDLVNLRQANISSYMSSLVLAPSGDALVVLDADGFIHLWGSPSKLRFTEFSTANPDWGVSGDTVPMLDLSQDIPLHTIGMPYYREQLLSAWSRDLIYEVGEPSAKIDPDILKVAQPNEMGLWAPNPRKVRRNQAEKKRTAETNGSAITAPKFLSEKAKDAEYEQLVDHKVDELQDALVRAGLNSATKSEVPAIYRNVEIKYSRFGVDDFDFEFYNKTNFSGLETHIANSYTNPLLQLLRFTPLFRNLALRHTATSCLNDACLLCELGFLFDTLEKAEGQNCQATNFLKALSGIPQASRMGLLEESSQGTGLLDMIQSACRFILSQTADDFRRISPALGDFENTLAINALTSIRCIHCHNETIRPGGGFITDLTYLPTHSPSHRQRQTMPTFSQILKASVELQTQTRGWCDKCRRYQQLATKKKVQKMPDILMINTALKSNEARQYWATPAWLPDSIGVSVDDGKFFCFEGEDLRLHLAKGMHVIKVYDLVGVVVDVTSSEHQKSHLVSLINVDISARESTKSSNWHLFNDFLVRQVPKEEALSFPSSWKSPTVIAFQVNTARHGVDDTWKSTLDTTLLYHHWSINNRPPENHRVLDTTTEAPSAGTYVAIDTEFVALQQEEIEIKADGDREIIRPTRLGLARVSVLRGTGVDEGLPFINDYITIREDIVDYLTKYSGVAKGDLDPQYSPHTLVPLKVAYKKLWLLVNLGCIFVGHGLPKDFRTINIHVPKAQVLDTVDLFYLKARQRRLSLRFLAWFLLKEDIQLANHDSIEDARTALRLLRKFEEFRDAGIVESMVEEVYREGKKWGYKPPAEAQALARGFGAGAASSLGVPGSSVMDGRETPEILRGASGPGTPRRKKEGGSGEYFESPMR